jgi:hypothetical protein
VDNDRCRAWQNLSGYLQLLMRLKSAGVTAPLPIKRQWRGDSNHFGGVISGPAFGDETAA